MRLTYKVKPVERQLPSAREVKTRAEADLLRLFVEAFEKRKAHPDDLALARRLLSHEQAETVIAALLRDHLGARPEAAEEATAARRAKAPRRAEAPLPVAAPVVRVQRTAPHAPEPSAVRAVDSAPRAAEPSAVKSPPRAEGAPPNPVRSGPERKRPRRESPARSNGRNHSSETDDLPRYTVSDVSVAAAPLPGALTREPELSPADAALRERSEDGEFAPAREGVAEIYVSIGRRDGARPSDIQTILEQNGLNSEQTDYIRVRQRNSFVGVKTEYLEKAVSALNGAAIAGKPAFAEPARQRD